MKTSHSRTRFAFLRHAVAALAFSFCAPGWAQQTAAPEIPKEGQLKLAPEPPKGAQSTAAPEAASAREAARSAMQTILPEIDIPAGQHLRGVVELLSAKTGANIVLEESLKDLKLPALKLRNVTITSVLDTIRTISQGEIFVSYSEDRGPGAPVVIVYPSRRGEIRKPLKICRVFRLPDPATKEPFGGNRFERGIPPMAADSDNEKSRKAAHASETAAKALEEIVEQISAAARQACSALAAANGQKKADADYPQIAVHAPTYLLIVTGEEADVDLVEQSSAESAALPWGAQKPQ
jgi:hypothetical protein